jgi:arabinofuranosyltransferase
MKLNTKTICIIGIFVSFILFILMLVYVWNFTVDDAFISFRYSEHLASGFGLVWNIGQPPVEGYTNFLWVLILAFLFLFKLNPVFSTKVIGLFSVFGIIILFWFITNDFFKDQKNKLIAFSLSTIFLLVNPLTAIHTVSGLETMLYSFLLLGVMYSAWKIIISPNSKFIWLFAFTALLLSLTRPEGILISFALIFSIIYISFKKNNNSIKLTSFSPVLVLYLIPIISYNVFRVLYFHALLPLPFLVKIVYGITFPIEFLNALIYLIPFILIILIPLFLKKPRFNINENNLKNFKYLLLILGIIFIFANIVYVNTPLMNYSQRFFYPTFVLFYLTFGITISILFNEIIKNKNINLANNTRIILTSTVIIVLLVLSSYNGINDLKIQHDYGINFNNSYIPIGEAISPFFDDNYTVAFADAGAVAYFSGWNFLDLGGLNDKFITENGVTTEYLEQKNPELVIFASVDGVILTPGKSYNYVLENNYTRLDPIKNSYGYYFIPFLKPKIKDFDSIKNSLEIVSKESNSNE